jgi:predicted neuraminidase
VTWVGNLLDPSQQVEPLNDSAILTTQSGRLVTVFIDRKSLVFQWNTDLHKPEADSRAKVYAATSDDNGKTWKLGNPLQTSYSGATRGLIEMEPGHLVATSQEMTPGTPRSVTLIFESTDNGTTWKKAATLDIGGRGHHDGGYECDLVRTKDGAMLVMRTNLDSLYVSRTSNGHDWTRPQSMGIPSSSSPGDLLRLQDGRLMLVYNPLYPTGENTTRRTSGEASQSAASWYRREFYVRMSEDDGRTWGGPKRLYESNTDVAYPTLFEYKPGLIWLTTYQGQARFAFRVADVDSAPIAR